MKHDRSTLRPLALAGCALALACVSDDPARTARVEAAIAGVWTTERELPDRTGWRATLLVLDGAKAPQPRRLEIASGGSFSAAYPPEEMRRVRAILGRARLETPVVGRWSLSFDWRGNAWIRFDPGAPARRVTTPEGGLFLHGTGERWDDERYRRSPD